MHTLVKQPSQNCETAVRFNKAAIETFLFDWIQISTNIFNRITLLSVVISGFFFSKMRLSHYFFRAESNFSRKFFNDFNRGSTVGVFDVFL